MDDTMRYVSIGLVRKAICERTEPFTIDDLAKQLYPNVLPCDYRLAKGSLSSHLHRFSKQN